MARRYSLDLRERVVASVAGSEPAGWWPSHTTWALRVWSGGHSVRRTGSAATKPMGGRRPYLPEKERGWLLGRLAEKPDLTLHALPRKLGERGIVVSCDPLWRSLKREGVSFKKPCLRPSGIALTSPAAGPGGSDTQRKIDPARLVFIDETWAKTNMVRTHGWRRRGIPLRARLPHGHWRTMTFLAALRHDRIDAP